MSRIVDVYLKKVPKHNVTYEYQASFLPNDVKTQTGRRFVVDGDRLADAILGSPAMGSVFHLRMSSQPFEGHTIRLIKGQGYEWRDEETGTVGLFCGDLQEVVMGRFVYIPNIYIQATYLFNIDVSQWRTSG